MATLIAVFTLGLGLAIGSFLSVCVYRIPLGRVKGFHGWEDEDLTEEQKKEQEEEQQQHISIVSPARSFCPACNKQLTWWQNIPVLSWIILRGRCHSCGISISARYPCIELLSALFAYLALICFGLTPTALLIYAFTCALIVISFIDYDYYIIPNVISLPGTIIGVAVGITNSFTHWFDAPVTDSISDCLIGLVSGSGFLFLISRGYYLLRKREGLGMGDVKLLAMTGAFFGAWGAFHTIFLGSFLGSILGTMILLTFGRKFSRPLPFGPYLALGTIAYIYIFHSPESTERFIGLLAQLTPRR